MRGKTCDSGKMGKPRTELQHPEREGKDKHKLRCGGVLPVMKKGMGYLLRSLYKAGWVPSLSLSHLLCLIHMQYSIV